MNQSIPMPRPGVLAAAFAHCLSRLRGASARWSSGRRQRATRLSLQQLDDRTLRDLGFDRSEIPSIAADLFAARDRRPERLVTRL